MENAKQIGELFGNLFEKTNGDISVTKTETDFWIVAYKGKQTSSENLFDALREALFDLTPIARAKMSVKDTIESKFLEINEQFTNGRSLADIYRALVVESIMQEEGFSSFVKFFHQKKKEVLEMEKYTLFSKEGLLLEGQLDPFGNERYTLTLTDDSGVKLSKEVTANLARTLVSGGLTYRHKTTCSSCKRPYRLEGSPQGENYCPTKVETLSIWSSMDIAPTGWEEAMGNQYNVLDSYIVFEKKTCEEELKSVDDILDDIF